MDIDLLRDLRVLRVLCLLGAFALVLGVAWLTVAWRAWTTTRSRGRVQKAARTSQPNHNKGLYQ